MMKRLNTKKTLSLFAFSALSLPIFGEVGVPSYELVEADTANLNIVQYVENADGSYSSQSYGVSFGSDDIGDVDGGQGTSYYNWDSDTNSYVIISNWQEGDAYDIVVTGNAIRDITLSNADLAAQADGYYVFVNKGANSVDGGAFTNSQNLANGLTGVFVGNSAGSDSKTVGYGGAISMTSSNLTGILSGVFISNKVTSSNSNNALGGAIHIGTNYTLTNVQADFIANYAKATGSAVVQGGAINNVGKIDIAAGDFIANYASSNTGNAVGGAIFNSNTITSLSGDFLGNYATTASGNARGGAIYNSKTITSLSGDFLGNYATVRGSTGTAQGGAIYNSGSITFNASADNMQFTGNYVVDVDGTKTSNAIYNAGELNFNSSAVYKIVVNDGIDGDSEAYGIMNISSGTTVLNNVVSSQTITVEDGAILALGSVSIDGTPYSANLSASSLSVSSGGTLSFVASGTSVSSTITLGDFSIADGASVTLDLSKVFGDFTLTISLEEGDELGLYSFLNTELDVIFADTTVSSTANEDGSEYAYSVEDGEGGVLAEYNITTDGNNIIITGVSNVAVPEPSTYAMILGAIALGFAYYRRRK